MPFAGLWNTFNPKSSLTNQDWSVSFRMLTWQAITGSGADGLASAGFLSAFALILGATNFQIGILTAVPFVVQPLQIVTVVMVERLRRRKMIAVAAYFVSFSSWIPIALIPFVLDVPSALAVSILLLFTASRGMSNAFLNPTWMGWLRDIAPKDNMGNFFANRLRTATIAAAISGLTAAIFVDYWKRTVPENEVVFGYSIAMLVGSMVMGWSAVVFMARIPEPKMVFPTNSRPSMIRILATPFADKEFRHLINFLGFWHFASYLAVPFLGIYMLTVLEMPVSMVVGLGVLSQATNVLFLQVWGPMVDRLGSKAVLSVSSSLYLLSILGWVFTTMPDKYTLTVPLVIALHAFIGIASAGINIATTTIRMKLAPQSQTTSYLTAASLATNLGAGVSPLLGGLFADFFSVRHFKVSFEWVDPSHTVDFPALFLTGFDFLFVVAFIVGLFTLNSLARVREEGEVPPQVVLDELRFQTRNNFRVLQGIPGLNLMSSFPDTYMRYVPPIPGLGLAVGVTAYQLASTTHDAVLAVTRGTEVATDVGSKISHGVRTAVAQIGDLGRHSVEATAQATRGALHAAHEAGISFEHATLHTIQGVLKAIGDTSLDAVDGIWGVGYGSVLAADEVGEDLGVATAEAIDGAVRAAEELGLSEQEAATRVAQGAVEAASTLGQDAEATVRDVVIEKLIASDLASPDSS